MVKAIRWDAQMLDAYLRRTGQAKAAPAPDLPPSRAKYRNEKVEREDGEQFDSKKESRRWAVLEQMQAAGEISDLRRQVAFELAPAVRLAGEARKKPALRYVSDFCYLQGGQLVIEDCKSEPTRRLPAYRIKKHLLKTVLNLDIKEV